MFNFRWAPYTTVLCSSSHSSSSSCKHSGGVNRKLAYLQVSQDHRYRSLLYLLLQVQLMQCLCRLQVLRDCWRAQQG
jgi:hypothetical protein